MASDALPAEVDHTKKYDTVVSSGQSALGALLTLNGGAILAFLTFIGHLLDKRAVPRDGMSGLVIALGFFVAGAFFAVLAYGMIFLTNCYSRINRDKLAERLFIVTVICGFASIGSFLVGSSQAIRTFWSVAKLLVN